jgi:hypothetical protein
VKKPEQPTQEEIERVGAYWHWVEQAVRSQGFDTTPKPEQPTPQELARVAQWKHWLEVLACQHTSGITMSSFEGMTCSDCGEQMHMLSEAQIEEMKEKQNVE